MQTSTGRHTLTLPPWRLRHVCAVLALTCGLAAVWLHPGAVAAAAPDTPTASGIVIEVASQPASTTQFAFTHNIDGSSLFALAAGSSKSFAAVAPGQYTILQTDPAPTYDVTSITCTDGDATGTPSTADPTTRVAVVNLDADEIVTCRFVNSRRGTLVVQQANNPPTAAAFTFAATPTDAGNFTLDNGQTRAVYNVPAGDYTVTQTDGPAGWLLDKIVCDDTSSSRPSTGDVATRRAQVRIDPGETVTCTFANERPGLRLTESHAGIDLDEATGASYGNIACYWLTLASAPDAPVRIVIQPDAEVQTSTREVVLDASNWATLNPADSAATNRVCVTPVGDDVAEHGEPVCIAGNTDILGETGSPVQLCGDHVGEIGHTLVTTDTIYARPDLPLVHVGPNLDDDDWTVDVLLTDDDTPAVVIAESDGSSEVTEGSSGVAGYWVWLASQPTADVTVTVAPDAQVRTDRTQLRFTPSTWKNRQLVRISAVDDDIAEGEHQAQVTHTVASADGQYNDPGVAFVGNGADPRVVHVTVSDNDTAGLAVAPTELAVVEGEIALYNVRLASRCDHGHRRHDVGRCPFDLSPHAPRLHRRRLEPRPDRDSGRGRQRRVRRPGPRPRCSMPRAAPTGLRRADRPDGQRAGHRQRHGRRPDHAH
ncbi:MAG: hypothetical protein R2854_07760 [Caldilineaceae bacterium]